MIPTAGSVGLDHVLATDPASYGRIGWLVGGSAVTTDSLVWGPSAALAAGFHVTQLLGPEHGLHGAVKEGQTVDDAPDPVTGLPVYSLYRADGDRLREVVGGCDTIWIDLVDLGARYSTYVATAIQVLEAAADAGRRVLVLDRPNILGRRRRGPGLGPGAACLVARVPVPIRHGLTLGELLRWHVRTTGLGVETEVVPAGWDGEAVGLGHAPYLPPSPNLDTVAAQNLYIGTCLVEGTTLSEGRGTANPFQVVGAPWLDADAVLSELRADGWPGVAFRRVAFVPLAGKHAGEVCQGVFLHLLDPETLDPLALGVRLLALAFATSPRIALRGRGVDGRTFLDQLWGSGDLAAYLTGGRAAETPLPIEDLGGFDGAVAPDLLYP